MHCFIFFRWSLQNRLVESGLMTLKSMSVPLAKTHSHCKYFSIEFLTKICTVYRPKIENIFDIKQDKSKTPLSQLWPDLLQRVLV